MVNHYDDAATAIWTENTSQKYKFIAYTRLCYARLM